LSDLKLSERLRVYAAVNGSTNLTLTKEQAASLISICERLEDNNADHEEITRKIRKHQATVDRLQWLQDMNESYLQYILRLALCVAISKEIINICKALVN